MTLECYLVARASLSINWMVTQLDAQTMYRPDRLAGGHLSPPEHWKPGLTLAGVTEGG